MTTPHSSPRIYPLITGVEKLREHIVGNNFLWKNTSGPTNFHTTTIFYSLDFSYSSWQNYHCRINKKNDCGECRDFKVEIGGRRGFRGDILIFVVKIFIFAATKTELKDV